MLANCGGGCLGVFHSLVAIKSIVIALAVWIESWRESWLIEISRVEVGWALIVGVQGKVASFRCDGFVLLVI